MTKTNKSFQKRLKITRTGKVLSRKAGQNHFRAKSKRKKQMDQKRLRNFNISKKTLSRYLPL
jgi:ribosomal protein L35